MKNFMNNTLELMISEEAILQKIASFASILDQKYQAGPLVVVMILKGAICFTADLIRFVSCPTTLETIKCQSYGHRGVHRGDLKILGIENLHIEDQDVLVIDDIYDSGITLDSVLDELRQLRPKSLSSAVLLAKKIDNRTVSSKPDYVMFEIENEFVVGYGLDFKEFYRGLRGIYKFIEKG